MKAKILIIDSHKGSETILPQNMHWKNAYILANYLNADLIWSYPSVNNKIKSDYDIIIFNHASHYSYVDYAWLKNSPDARLFYITNEYNLGEPRILWAAAKQGKKYDVIANHSPEVSKIVYKYVNNWHNLNLNSLIYEPKSPPVHDLFSSGRSGCIYYGSFRSNRKKYFSKYLTSDVLLSTHAKNIKKFKNVGVTASIRNRIDWDNYGLFSYRYSLYIEDEKTHDNYNFLANRFYEALNYNCIPLFAVECLNTIDLSGYKITSDFIISDSKQIHTKQDICIDPDWHRQAAAEKINTFNNINNILLRVNH